MSSLLARSGRSYLVERPSSTAGHRAPAMLAPTQLEAFFQQLRAEGTELIWEGGRGFLLCWRFPHQPIIEAQQIDLVRASYELLLRHFNAKEIPQPVAERGVEISCWHAWHATQHLPSYGEQLSLEDERQENLFDDVQHLSEQTPLCFADIETTGGSKLEDRVIQLALCRVEPTGEVQNYVSYFNPEGRTNKAFFINRVPDWELKRAPLFKRELHHFLPLLSGAAFIAHNARCCDEPFLNEELRRAQASWPCIAVIDTLPVSRRVWPHAPKHKLEVLAPWLGIHQGKIHDAQGDVETLMALWFAIREARPELKLAQLAGW